MPLGFKYKGVCLVEMLRKQIKEHNIETGGIPEESEIESSKKISKNDSSVS